MKYKLLKDLPWAKAGAIVVIYPKGHSLHEMIYRQYIHDPDWFSPVDERFKPKDGEIYWFVTSDYPNSWHVKQTMWNGSCEDDFRWRAFIVFRTEQQVFEAAKRIKQTFLDCHKKFANE